MDKTYASRIGESRLPVAGNASGHSGFGIFHQAEQRGGKERIEFTHPLGGEGFGALIQVSALHQGGNIRLPQLHHSIGIAVGEHPGQREEILLVLGIGGIDQPEHPVDRQHQEFTDGSDEPAVSGAGHLGVGWTMEEYNLIGGFLRVLFSFSIGLLMSRVFKPIPVKGAFWICSLAIVVLLSMPYVGNGEALWMNGIYDSVCAILIFPMLVYLGASGKTTDKHSARICKFLGDISYPLYMVHYPLIYLYFGWVKKENLTFAEAWPEAVALVVGSIVLAYISLKLYDEPVRRYLTKRFLQVRK